MRFFTLFLRLLKLLLLGTIVFFSNLTKIREKKYIVYLFSSRFGHFLMNTEIFLRNLNSTKEYLFVTENKIDNQDLLNIWKRKLDIFPMYLGDFLRVFLNFKIIHIRALVIPQSRKYIKKRIIKKIKLNPNFENFNSLNKKKYISLTIRDSEYNKKMYNDYRASFRDTNLKDFKKTISYFVKKKNNFVKVNKSFNDYKIKSMLDYGLSQDYDLETAFSIIKNSEFHIGSSTGLDTYPALIDKKMVIFNAMFGASFTSRLHTFPTMFIPSILFLKKTKR